MEKSCNKKGMWNLAGKWRQLCSLLTCVLMIMAVAVSRDGQVLGTSIRQEEKQPEEMSAVRHADDGSLVVSTKELAKDVKGFGGNVPLEIYVDDGRIVRIEALDNSETPEVFGKVKEQLLPQWEGKSIDEALDMEVDGVSGATLSSNAVIESAKRGLAHIQGIAPEESRSEWSVLLDPKSICTLIVALAAAILPLFIRSRRYRTLQLLLNIVVLGFWSASFISYSLLVSYLSNGVNLWTSLLPLILLVVAFIYPLFGKKSHYCNWVCPLGSLQEVIGKSVGYKLPVGAKTQKWLNRFREGLWAVLMLLMWTGVGFQWMDYELFAAFLFSQTSTAVLIAAIAFLLLSCVVMRPYCRFVCPTGFLLRISQNSK